MDAEHHLTAMHCVYSAAAAVLAKENLPIMRKLEASLRKAIDD